MKIKSQKYWNNCLSLWYHPQWFLELLFDAKIKTITIIHTAEHQLTKPISRHKCLLRAHSHRIFFGHPHTVEERCTVTYIILIKESVHWRDWHGIFQSQDLHCSFQGTASASSIGFFSDHDRLAVTPAWVQNLSFSSALSQACSGAWEKLCLWLVPPQKLLLLFAIISNPCYFSVICSLQLLTRCKHRNKAQMLPRTFHCSSAIIYAFSEKQIISLPLLLQVAL